MNNQDTLPPSPVAAPRIRGVGVERSLAWLVGGFRTFAKAPAPWLLLTLGILVASWLLGRFGSGWLSGALSTAFGIVIVGVLMRGCQLLDQGRELTAELQHTASSAPLWILAAIGAGLTATMQLILAIFSIGSLYTVGVTSMASVGGTFGLIALLMFAMAIVLGAALWLAPALVVLHGAQPVDALRLSCTATLRNIGPYLLYSLLAMVACVLGALPFGLGLLVVFPTLIAGAYLAYQDIFGAVGSMEE